MLLKRPTSLLLCFTSLLLSTTFSKSATAQYQAELEREEIGFEFEGQRELNQGIITHIKYYGQCPGDAYKYKRSWFTSSKYPPKKK